MIVSVKEVNLVGPCVPSHVAYEPGRGGNNPSEALGQWIHNRKVGAGTVRQRRICQHEAETGLGLIVRSEYTNARKRRKDRRA